MYNNSDKTHIQSIVNEYPNEAAGDAPVIFATRQYKLFTEIVGNRPILPAHLDKLILSIAEKNLLPFVPIIVNENLGIIDGQHRFNSARQAGHPIYYVVAVGAGIEDVRRLNDNSWSWSTKQHLHSFVARGYEDYITLDHFSNEKDLSIPLSVMILSDRYSHPQVIMQQFRAGNFSVASLPKAHAMADLLNSLKEYCADTCWRDRAFLLSIEDVKKQRAQGFDFSSFREKLQNNPNLRITRQVDRKHYIRQFEDLWNFKLKKNLVRLIY